MTRTMTRTRPLTVALEKVDFLAPDRVTDDTSILTLKNLVLEPLLRWRDGVVGPALFERWTHSSDGRDWTFDLRDDAVFHDGTRCTTDLVVAFIDRLLVAVDTFDMPWPYARYLAGVTLRAASPTRLLVSAPRSLGDIVDVFSEFYPSRLDGSGRAVVGTGPYRVDSFEAGREVVLCRIGDDHTAERLRFIACPGAAERLRRVRDGDCDAALGLERIDERLTFDEDLHWQCQVNTLSVMNYLDCTRGVFHSADARLAINRAIDVPRIVEELFDGLAIPSATIVSPFHLGFREAGLVPIACDRDDARRLFDRVGPIDPIVLRTPLSMPHKAEAVTRMIGAMLEDIGLDVRIETEPDRPAYARQIGAKRMGDSAIFDSSPHSTFRILNDKISSAVRGTWWQGYHDAEVEASIVAANDALGDAARARAYARCLVLLHRAPPWLYLFHPIEVLASRAGTPGFALDHKGILALIR